MQEKIAATFRQIQKEICSGLEQLDGKGKFIEDEWKRDGGGGGFSCVITNGDLVEKGGVNFSAVEGDLPSPLQEEFKTGNTTFFATGVSIVLHPKNPHVPIIHMNIRYFELGNGTWWFGGGIDLTPHYVDRKMASSFHNRLKVICDKYHPDYYVRFKKWADEYFFITHRNETRGIGGIFFDKLQENELDKARLFNFVCDLGRAFVPAYAEQVENFKNKTFSEKERQWQLLRRGRYVEFNLLLDRGTKFGLQTNGRTESILMSLPPTACWEYNFKPEKDSEESATLALLKKGIDWVNPN